MKYTVVADGQTGMGYMPKRFSSFGLRYRAAQMDESNG